MQSPKDFSNKSYYYFQLSFATFKFYFNLKLRRIIMSTAILAKDVYSKDYNAVQENDTLISMFRSVRKR